MAEVLLWVTAGAMIFTAFTKRFTWDAKWKILMVLMLNINAIYLSIIADLLRDAS